jgi:prepilin-type N-terminal cleavage/methylation domain-containing protein
MQQENKKIAKNTSVEKLHCNISKKSKGFTLVELIIVITILGILAIIAFISFQ